MIMKRFAYIALVALFVFPTVAQAQVPVTEEPLVNQYIENTYQQRSSTWWKALERQLALNLAVDYADVQEIALQNVIFFATLHADKLSFYDMVPSLLEVYRNHENEAYRIMALSALDAIGDERAMQQLYRVVEAKPDAEDRLHRLTLAAVYNHYQGR